MKHILTLIFTFSFFIASSQQIDEIIDSYLELIGGVEAIQEVEGIKIYASTNQQGLEIPVEIVQSKNRSSLKLTLQGQELKQGVFVIFKMLTSVPSKSSVPSNSIVYPKSL